MNITFEEITSSLEDYTGDFTISFIDLYGKTKRNFSDIHEVTEKEQLKIDCEFQKAMICNLKHVLNEHYLNGFGVLYA